MDIDKFISIDLERDLKILLCHYKNHKTLGLGDDDILNAVFVGSLIKGRFLLDMLGVKSNSNRKLCLGKVRNGDITAKLIGGRFVLEEDFIDGEEAMLCDFLTSVNKAEAHRNRYDQNNDDIIHPSILTILRLVYICIYKQTDRQIGYEYAKKIINEITIPS